MTSEQLLVGYRTNEEWNELVAQVAAKIEALEGIGDEELRRQVFDTFQAIDTVHREALHRLVRLFKQGVLEQVVTDPAIHTLMGMYDLLPASHGHAAFDFLTPEERAAGPRAEPKASPPPQQVADVDRDRARAYPHWSPVRCGSELADGDAMIVDTDDGAVVIAKADGINYCIDASCPAHGGIMYGGALSHVSWICPLGPGCVYDIRNGTRIGGGKALGTHPVRVTEPGGLQVGFGIPHVPKLPAF